MLSTVSPTVGSSEGREAIAGEARLRGWRQDCGDWYTPGGPDGRIWRVIARPDLRAVFVVGDGSDVRIDFDRPVSEAIAAIRRLYPLAPEVTDADVRAALAERGAIEGDRGVWWVTSPHREMVASHAKLGWRVWAVGNDDRIDPMPPAEALDAVRRLLPLPVITDADVEAHLTAAGLTSERRVDDSGRVVRVRWFTIDSRKLNRAEVVYACGDHRWSVHDHPRWHHNLTAAEALPLVRRLFPKRAATRLTLTPETRRGGCGWRTLRR